MTLQSANGDVPTTVSISVNGSIHLVRVVDGWVTRCIVQTISRTLKGLRVSYHEYFKSVRISYNLQQSCFHPSTVGMIQLVRHQWIRVIFTKWIEK